MLIQSDDTRRCLNFSCARFPECKRGCKGCSISDDSDIDWEDPTQFIQPEECNAGNGYPYFT